MRFRLLISGLISIQIVDLKYGGNRQCQLSNQIAQGLVVSHSMLSLSLETGKDDLKTRSGREILDVCNQ